jgi:CubicO group peptidase (beta-lactamase class C family)
MRRLVLLSLLLAHRSLFAQGGAPGSSPDTTPSAVVEHGLLPAVIDGETDERMSLRERMRHHHVPGVSVAVLRGGRVVWAGGYGTISADGGPSVDVGTRFQAASLSKPVTALVALSLVRTGTLALDDDVDARLRGWLVGGAITRVETSHRVTLRGLLSHSAGLSTPGFRGYAAVERVPSLTAILRGDAPANSEPITRLAEPGERRSYSGGGYVVVQKLVQDVTGTPFADLAQRLVLSPLRMQSSSFALVAPPVSRSAESDRARGHDREGRPIAGGWYRYPEAAAAGLWTTAMDMARVLEEMARVAAGREGRVLTSSLGREMLSVVPVRDDAGGPTFGLGVEINGQGADRWIGHTGANEGYRARMLLVSASGDGAVILTNADGGGALIDEIVRGLAHAYRWPELSPAVRRGIALPDSTLASLEGRYRFGPGELVIRIEHDARGLRYRLPWSSSPSPLRPIAPDRFVSVSDGTELTFLREPGESRPMRVEVQPSNQPPLIGQRESVATESPRS